MSRIRTAVPFWKHSVWYTVLSYRKIEDEQRRDQTEGTGHYTIDGVDIQIEFCSNTVYAMCCHKDIKSALKARHGKYIVKIAEPLYLAEELTRTLRGLSSKHFGGIEGVYVGYDKGTEKEDKLNSYHASRLTYSQKPVCFSHENEFRFVFIRKEFSGSNIFLKLKNGVGGSVICKTEGKD